MPPAIPFPLLSTWPLTVKSYGLLMTESTGQPLKIGR